MAGSWARTLALALVAALLAQPSRAEDLNSSDAVRDAVFQIRVSKPDRLLFGTAVSIGHGVALTAAHILAGLHRGDHLQAIVHGVRTVEATVFFKDEETDRAVIRLTYYGGIGAAQPCEARPESGKKVAALSYGTIRRDLRIAPVKTLPTLPLDTPADKRKPQDMLAVGTMLQHGSSGGGVIDAETGCLYGIISFVDGEALTYAIPVDRFQPLEVANGD